MIVSRGLGAATAAECSAWTSDGSIPIPADRWADFQQCLSSSRAVAASPQRIVAAAPGVFTQQDIQQAQIAVAAAQGSNPPANPAPVSTPAASGPLSVQFVNLTRGTPSSFNPGDSWQLVITGAAPNQPVTVTGTQNGKNLGSTQVGTTDANGNFTLPGQMTAGNIGAWTESWLVGGKLAAQLNFQVLQSPGPTPSQSSTPPDPTSTTTGMNTGTPAGPVDTGIATPPASLSSIPTWAWVVGVAGLGFLAVRGEM